MTISYFRAIISGFLTLWFLLSPLCPPRSAKCEPVFNGSFIQSWMCASWGDERWEKEADVMKEAGIEYLILQTTADKDGEGIWRVNFPTEIEALKDATVVGNVVESALRCCNNKGIKVIVGLSMFDDWWREFGTTVQYTEVCTIAADMAEEIYTDYKSAYPDTLYGWYFVPEINNVQSMKDCILQIADGVNIVIDKLNTLDATMPLAISPYYNEYVKGTSAKATLEMWTQFIDRVNFRPCDIFAPQDSVGAGSTSEATLESIYKMYYSAVKASRNKVRLWANCENFTSPHAKTENSGITTPAATLNIVPVPTTLDRLVRQMQTVSPYVENIITFSYNHYCSPLLVNPVYHNTYVDYLNNSLTLDAQKPTAPTDVTMSKSGDNVTLSWQAASDNIGIACYIIYADGEPVRRAEYSGGAVMTSITFGSSATSFAVAAVDGAGNISEMTAA